MDRRSASRGGEVRVFYHRRKWKEKERRELCALFRVSFPRVIHFHAPHIAQESLRTVYRKFRNRLLLKLQQKKKRKRKRSNNKSANNGNGNTDDVPSLRQDGT